MTRDDVKKLVVECENELTDEFKKIDDNKFFFSEQVLNSFKKNNLSENAFNSTTGYGYNDLGREIIEKVYADIFKSESAIVRSQFISGSHALNVTFFALLRPGDLLLCISITLTFVFFKYDSIAS